MNKKFGYYNTVVNNTTGKGIKATISVYKQGSLDYATIYKDTTGVLKANPFETDELGRIEFFVDVDMYDIQISGQDIMPYKLEGIMIGGISLTPAGKQRITNVYIDPDTQKVTVEYDDIPV